MKLTKAIANEIVAKLEEEEIHAYAQTSEQFLFADEVCSRHEFHNSEANVDKFEIALDDRAVEMGIF